MRKLWFAVAGGMLLFGATPAHADGADPVDRVLQRTNDWRIASPLAADPLSGEPLVGIEQAGRPPVRLAPGDNSANLGALVPNRASESADLPPAADVIGGTLPSRADRSNRALDRLRLRHLPDTARQVRIANRPVASMITDRVFFGLLPDGRSLFGADRRTESAGDGVPLLGGLDGLAGASTPGEPDTTGLPLGGTPVSAVDVTRPGSALGYPAPAASSPAPVDPATTAPTAPPATSPATSPAAVAPADSPATVDPAQPAASPSTATPSAPGYSKSGASTSASAADADPRLYEEPHGDHS